MATLPLLFDGMNYEQVIDYIYNQLPMYHRSGAAAYKPGLENIHALMKLIGNPERGLKYVHVAGTNGKGSTSTAIASVLQEAGYKAGLFTSPHLKDFRERIRINGAMIQEEAVADFVTRFHKDWEPLSPSFFEITTALAFDYFQKRKTDIVVLEVGMGGRLDSTNIIIPELSVITNIGMDHTQFLGNTIEKITGEKAGIIKEKIPVVLGKMRSEAREVIEEKVRLLNAPLIFSDFIHDSEIPEFELKGNYQHENSKTALAALRVLKELGWKISDENISDGFRHITQNTGMRGRWQVLNDSPLTIADVGHNEDGIRWVVKQIEEQNYRHLHFVIGVVNDKDLSSILPLLPKEATYYFCKANIPRGLDAAVLREKAAEYGLNGQAYPSVADAFENAKSSASPEDMIFVGGSVFTVAEVL